MFNLFSRAMEEINTKIESDLAGIMTDERFLEREIGRFLGSVKRREMLCGERYYDGEQDILKRKREVIGEGGELREVKNLPNNRLVDNQFCRLVDQKTGYFLGKPFTVKAENEKFEKALNGILGKDFLRIIRLILQDCYIGGIGWLYIYYNEEGSICFRRFKPYEILPFWKDEEHTELELAVRIYRIYGYDGENESYRDKVEVYGEEGIRFYEFAGQRLTEEENGFAPYVSDGEEGYGFKGIPLIAFKANSREIPLIKRVKCLQDALNEVRSDFMNNMQEDCRNTIIVLKNYDGEDLGEFRHNLSRYGAVKVRSAEGCDGGVDTLKVDVNSENYKSICDMLKKAIIENGGGYDGRDERFNSNPNQLNIKSMFSEIDIDTNNTEVEFLAAFEKIFGFLKDYIANSGGGDFKNENAEVIFNRDVLINEKEAIENCSMSLGVLSRRTVVEQHPWVKDAGKEMERLEGTKEQ